MKLVVLAAWQLPSSITRLMNIEVPGKLNLGKEEEVGREKRDQVSKSKGDLSVSYNNA